MTQYVRTASNIKVSQLHKEITASAIVTTLDGVSDTGEASNNLLLDFAGALSGGDETLMDSTISAHTPDTATAAEIFDRNVSETDGSRSDAMLSASETTLVFNEQMSTNGDYLSISSFAHSDAGYVMPQGGRIVKVSGRAASQTSGTKYLDILVDDTVIQGALTFTAAIAESQYSNTTDIGFTAGQRIRTKTRMPNGKRMNHINIVIWIRWEI